MTDSPFELENRFTSGVYAKRDVCFVRGDGIRLWDENGKEYLDFGTGISVANLGHCHPRLVAAIQHQAATLVTSPELGYNDRRAELLSRLQSQTPEGINRFFLCNSGTEAVEGCIKFASYSTGRSKFVAAMRGFHGRTIGSLAATHNKKYREPFQSLTPKFEHIPFNSVEKLQNAIDDNTAGIIIELVQGEGGVRIADQSFVTAARDACEQHGSLLIIDEVQTGFGRTGKLFACEHFGVHPDLMSMGKAIAGGVPMGAIGIADSVGELKPGVHGSTFGGNPLACAGAIEVLKVIEEDGLAENARQMGEYFAERLKRIDSPQIREIRQLGLMIGVDLRIRVGSILKELMEHGFMVLNAGPTVVRFLPPLTVQKQHIDAVVDTFEKCLQGIEAAESASSKQPVKSATQN